MAESKKRVIKSLETLPDDLRDLVKKQYPNGYESNITRISNAKKEPIFVFPLETAEATYLIKIPFTKNSEGEYDVESGSKGSGEFDDANEDDFNNSDDFGGDYEEGDDSGKADPSYDPDFDD